MENTVIDITDLIAEIQNDWVKWGSAAVFAYVATVPGLNAIIAFPIVNFIARVVVKNILTLLSKSTEMLAFFANTAIRKASQARDYIDSIHAQKNLPQGSSDETVLKAEELRALRFRNFVVLGN